MIRKTNKYIVLLLALMTIFGCIKEPEPHAWTVTIFTEYPEIVTQQNVEMGTVNLFNQLKNYSLQQGIDVDGKAEFTNVEPGFYSATMTQTYSQNGRYYHLNGILEVEVFDSMADTLKMTESSNSAFVIKEFYYSGSQTVAGGSYFADQYIEIFNNTPSIQYADGLSILEHESNASGENYWSHIQDSIVVKMIWTIPGDGDDVMVLPGESIVIAQDGFNHRDDALGNPNSPVNLGDADFEFFVKWDTDNDVDMPFVENMEENFFVYRAKDVVFFTRGGSAIALAKIPGNNDLERSQFINSMLVPKGSSASANTKYFAKISNAYVLDAVEVTWDEAHAIYKRLPIELDAGYTYVASGTKSGKCVRRKIAEVINGRVVYQDTDNSTEDFLKDVVPNPRAHE